MFSARRGGLFLFRSAVYVSVSTGIGVLVARKYTRDIKPAAFEAKTLLGKSRESLGNYTWVDHFATEVEAKTLPSQFDGTQFARAFMTSRVFSVELALLNAIARNFPNLGTETSLDEVEALSFAVGDSVGPFRVQDRAENEVLWRTTDDGTELWLRVQPFVKVVPPAPLTLKERADGVVRSPEPIPMMRLSMGSQLLPGANESIVARIMIPFHKLYSAVLLKSATRNAVRKGRAEAAAQQQAAQEQAAAQQAAAQQAAAQQAAAQAAAEASAAADESS